MTAAAQVLQLVRAHFRRDETAFLSAATILARAAKTPSIRNGILETLRRGYESGPRPSSGGFGGASGGALTLRSRRPSGQVAQQHLRAHRLAWELWFGPAPADLLALHACDTPACVNPLHITFGTQKRNREECAERGRTARGERNGNRRFTEADVTRMRALSAAGQALPEIGEAFGCDPRTVYSIVQRRTWGHVA